MANSREVVAISRETVAVGAKSRESESSGNVVGVYARRLRCFSIVGLYEPCDNRGQAIDHAAIQRIEKKTTVGFLAV